MTAGTYTRPNAYTQNWVKNGSDSSADFEIDGTTLVKYNGRESHVIIPSTVTVIGKNVFFDYSFIKGVTIPSSVTTIGENAFGPTELTSVTIPSSVIIIEHGAFQEIPGLKNIDIPSSVSTIGDYAFFDCRNLTSVTLSRNTIVANNVFPTSVQINYRD